MVHHFHHIEKIKKLVANLHDKKENAIHMRNLKQALYHELVLKKVIIPLNSVKKLS